jgi:hypothetical protein
MTVSLIGAAAKGRLAERMVPQALEFACLVRDRDAEGIGGWLGALTDEERDVLPLVLAAMVDIDRTPAELLSWVTFDELGQPLPEDAQMVLWSAGQRKQRKDALPCGTPAAAQRHYKNREPLCGPCRAALDVQKEQRLAEKAQREEGAA